MDKKGEISSKEDAVGVSPSKSRKVKKVVGM
jgi:hypothetical protein